MKATNNLTREQVEAMLTPEAMAHAGLWKIRESIAVAKFQFEKKPLRLTYQPIQEDR